MIIQREQPTRILVVVVSYGSEAETSETLTWMYSLAAAASAVNVATTEWIMWDNQSTSATTSTSGGVTYTSDGRGNIGFGSAVNSAVRGRQYDRLLLLNPDIVLRAEHITRVIEKLARLTPSTIWAPTLVNPDGTIQTVHDGLFLRTLPQELLDIFGKAPRRSKTRPPRFYLRGAVFSISRELFSEADGFDPRFFLYGEEADLCFRLSPKATLQLDSDVSVVHLGSQGSSGKSSAALRHSLRARWMIQRDFTGPLAGIATRGACAIYLVLYSLKYRIAKISTRSELRGTRG